MTRSGLDEKLELRALARLHGIDPVYRDGVGNTRIVPVPTLKTILGAMQVAAGTPEEIQQSLTEVRCRPWKRLVDEVCVLWHSEPSRIWSISIPLGEGSFKDVVLKWELEDEGGSRRTYKVRGSTLSPSGSRIINGVRYIRVALSFPKNLSIGYYRLFVSVMGLPKIVQGQALVIVAPKQCYGPSDQTRSWGVMVQLYGVRSSRNWGIGDFGDLHTLTTWAGKELGAATIGLNPLHALTPDLVSPYSPSSRLFHNPLYLDIEAIGEFRNAPSLQRQVRSRRFQTELCALRNHRTVQYEDVCAVKWPILESLFQVFRRQHLSRSTQRAKNFHRFVRKQGRPLEQFAVFQALQERFQGSTWSQWPLEFRHPDSPGIARFVGECRGRVQFYQYVQWQCELQLQSLDQAALRSKMPYGFFHDLAVGIHPDGADAWVFQDQLARGVTLGAPPDLFNLAGQNWNLQPPLPQHLRAHGYQFLAETFRHNMQHGGILRIDHALGLFRLFWIPKGGSGEEGAYVRYPTHELLAVLAVESVRNKVMVIGEDLGTVTPVIRKRLAEAGLLSYRLLLFEKPPNSGYRSPRQFPPKALVSVTTHDLPTLRGFWVGRDIEEKERVGLYPSKDRADQDQRIRAKDRKALLQALRRERLLPPGAPSHTEDLKDFTEEYCRATYAYLARTPCQVLAISMEDLLGELDTPNLPGAPPGTYPVWQRKLSRPIEQWQNDSGIREFAHTIHHERNSRPTRLPPRD